jgi:desulfoferrodoxin (superoxide reductase-like protein)
LTLKGEVKGLKIGETIRVGDLVTFDVSVDKIPHLKACCSHRLWLVLINQTSREVQMMEFRQNYDKIEQ